MNQEYKIMSVDLADFESGDPQRRTRFVEELGAAFNEIGFVALSNHDLSAELQARVYAAVESFFSLSMEQKRRYIIEQAHGQRGYSCVGTEQAVGAEVPDLKEFWQYGRELLIANPEVAEVPEFRAVCAEVFAALEKTGQGVLRAVALYLGLPETYFHARVASGQSLIRCIHYPPITEAPKNALRAHEHEDIDLITLLMGASASGLEILNKAGVWVPVTALPGQLVINIGDMMQRLTNGVLKSTTHRVVNPPKETWGSSRYSIPFFMHPASDVSLQCLPQTITTDRPKAYADMTAGEYLAERLEAIRVG